MNHRMYPKLAFSNIKKNSRFYVPYFLTCTFSIAMFYIMCAIAFDRGLSTLECGPSLIIILRFGVYIIGLFSIIFLFYTNNFLMKRRRREMGLYNILGMEKKHIAKVIAYESIDIAVASIILGGTCGVIFCRLCVLLLNKMLNHTVEITLSFSPKGMVSTLVLFGIIFSLILLKNIARITVLKPIELLREGIVGEREPKSKWLLALIGIACIGTGYYIALTEENPIQVLSLFFIAVILVIIGTYCMFTAGSIVFLKLLRKNKKFYYQTKHFYSISGMIYRMKQNAVGLANICILSTMVLIMVSGTVSLIAGIQETVDKTYPKEISVCEEFEKPSDKKMQQVQKNVRKVLSSDIIKNESEILYLPIVAELKDDVLMKPTNDSNMFFGDIHYLCIMTAKEYQILTGKKIVLKQDEVAVSSQKAGLPTDFVLFQKKYHQAVKADHILVDGYGNPAFAVNYIFVANEEVLSDIKKNVDDTKYNYLWSFDIAGGREQKLDTYSKIMDAVEKDKVEVASKQRYSDFYIANTGSLLFIGTFLSLLFLIATGVIIYYKQISEGYEDKERFAILQKVGMSQLEIKHSIHSQILMIFFLPLIVAFIHVAAAVPMIRRMLTLVGFSNPWLFILCAAITIVIFSIIYAVIFRITAKMYYRIVK